MNRGYKFISFILFSLATHVRADVIDLRENLFAKANTEEGLNEPAVRIDSQSNLHRSSLQYLVSASGTRLPIQFVSQTDPSRKTFIFIGGLDSDIETFSKLEEILLPLGYGSLRIELRGQGSLIAKPPNIESLSLASQAKDLISILDQLNIDKKKLALVGLSYGAAVIIQTAFEILSKDHSPVASMNLISPLLPSETKNSSFSSVFLHLKNISDPLPQNIQEPKELLAFLSTLGEYTPQSEGTFSLKDVTAAYNLFSGVSFGLADLLSTLDSRVNFFDGLADFILSTSEKTNIYEKAQPAQRGLYFRSEGATHRAPENSPEEVARFLIEANP